MTRNAINEYMLDTVIPGAYEDGNVSRMVQGSSIGYQYSIKPFTTELQQPVNDCEDVYTIHVGSLVRGVGVNNPDRHYTGYVNRILRNSDGSVSCLYILTKKNRKMVTINADDNLELLLTDSEMKNELK